MHAEHSYVSLNTPSPIPSFGSFLCLLLRCCYAFSTLCITPFLLGSTHVTSGSHCTAAAASVSFPPLVLLHCSRYECRATSASASDTANMSSPFFEITCYSVLFPLVVPSPLSCFDRRMTKPCSSLLCIQEPIVFPARWLFLDSIFNQNHLRLPLPP